MCRSYFFVVRSSISDNFLYVICLYYSVVTVCIVCKFVLDQLSVCNEFFCINSCFTAVERMWCLSLHVLQVSISSVWNLLCIRDNGINNNNIEWSKQKKRAAERSIPKKCSHKRANEFHCERTSVYVDTWACDVNRKKLIHTDTNSHMHKNSAAKGEMQSSENVK